MPQHTTINLPGVYRIEEASNKAISQLQRMANRRRISFIATDVGVIFQPGDVINVTSTNRGLDIDVYVESVVMVDYGRYRITGRDYSAAHFSNDFVTDTQWPLNQPDTTTSPWTFPDPGETPFFEEKWTGQPDCTLFGQQVLAMSSCVGYWPMNRQVDLDEYQWPPYIKDYSSYANHAYGSSAISPMTPQVQAVTNPITMDTYAACSGKVSLFRTSPSGGSTTSAICREAQVNQEWPLSNEWTYIIHHPQSVYGGAELGEFEYELTTGGRWTGGRLYMDVDGKTIRMFLQTERAAAQTSQDLNTYDSDWRKKTVGYRITKGATQSTMELLVDFVPTGVTCSSNNFIIFGVFESGQDLVIACSFAAAHMQEAVLFNEALTDAQLLQLRTYWNNNY